MLSKIHAAASVTVRTLSQVGLVVLLCFAASTLLDGLLRSFVDQPIELVRDIGGVVIAVAISLCFPQAFFERHNIVVSFIDGLLKGRSNDALRLLVSIVVLAIATLFAMQFYTHAGNVARAHEVSVAFRVPQAPFWYVVDFNLWVTVIAQGILVIEELVALITGEYPVASAPDTSSVGDWT